MIYSLSFIYGILGKSGDDFTKKIQILVFLIYKSPCIVCLYKFCF